MRLLNVTTLLGVEKSIDEGKDLKISKEVLVEFYGAKLAEVKYAILSHCWGIPEEGEEEVLFKDINELPTVNKARRNDKRKRSGYRKVLGTCRQASRDKLDWVWVDTCCINKDSSSELSEAINSMYKWYENSTQCYAYLHDLEDSTFPPGRDEGRFPRSNGCPKWFSRGWTLQELVAPRVLRFFNKKWEPVGDKVQLSPALEMITRIPESIFTEGLSSKRPCVAQIMSWASNRETTREEDRAYSLLGLLGVHMPMLYGEGKNAFRRLQLEIIRKSNDQSIFAWGHSRWTGWCSSFLADDPSCFDDCSDIVKTDPDDFHRFLKCNIPRNSDKQPHAFTLTNDGIQIWLPLTPCQGSSYFTATLACSDRRSEAPQIAIILGLFQSKFFRLFNPPLYQAPEKMRFEEVLLPYDSDDSNKSGFTFDLECDSLLRNGFLQHGVFPYQVQLRYHATEARPHTPGSISFSLSNRDDFCLISFKNTKNRTHLVIALSYCCGRHSALAVLSIEYALRTPEWLARLRLKILEEALRAARSWQDPQYFIQHTHLPQSIEGVRIVYKGRPSSQKRCTVMALITRCFGCCWSSKQMDRQLTDVPHVPGLMRDLLSINKSLYTSYELSVKRFSTCFVRADSSNVKLGDFGHILSGGVGLFKREGNIFDVAAGLGLNVAIEPVQSEIQLIPAYSVALGNGYLEILSNDSSMRPCGVLTLRDAICWSLPNNRQVVTLLESLAPHLSGKCLVTLVVECAECHDAQNQCNLRMWRATVDDYVPDLNSWRKLDTTTPLCAPMIPLAWCIEGSSRARWEELRIIWRHFDALIGWEDDLESGAFPNPGGALTVETAADFFVNIFGGNRFKEFVGDITFFDDLATERGETTHKDETKERASLDSDLSEDRRSTTRDYRVKTLLEHLLQFDESDWFLSYRETRLGSKVVELKSAPFGEELLRAIAGVYKGWTRNKGRRRSVWTDKCNFRLSLEEVKALREKFAEKDDDEEQQRALAEDITGKVTMSTAYVSLETG